MNQYISNWRIVAAAIIFVIWIGLSFAVFDAMVRGKMGEWWQITIPVAFLWLVYLGIAYFLLK
jgi:hypothetical protein